MHAVAWLSHLPATTNNKTASTSDAANKPAAAGLDRLARQTATTFAPRASGATGKNPASRGSTLYAVFEVQAWVALAVGGLLSFNVLFPTDEPSIPRLMG
jgi:hypothetical protein